VIKKNIKDYFSRSVYNLNCFIYPDSSSRFTTTEWAGIYRFIDNKRNWNSRTNAMNSCTIIMNSIQVPSPLFIKSFKSVPSFKCYCRSSDEKGRDDVKDALYGLVDEQVQELLSRKENKILLDGLEKASQRVEMAKRELELIQKQELAVKQLKDYVSQLEGEIIEVMIFFFFLRYQKLRLENKINHCILPIWRHMTNLIIKRMP